MTPHRSNIPRVLHGKFKRTKRPKPCQSCPPKDPIYALIEDACCRGYRMADNECGLPYIVPSDVEHREDGLVLVRFRLADGLNYALESVVEKVCSQVWSDRHLVVEEREEYGIPFLECAWVLVPDELKDTQLEDLFWTSEHGAFEAMGAFSDWTTYIGQHYAGKILADVAQFLGYSDENRRFLSCQETDKAAKVAIIKDFKPTIDFLTSTKMKAVLGQRTPLAYAKDRIAAWIGTDLVYRQLEAGGFSITRRAADMSRTIIPSPDHAPFGTLDLIGVKDDSSPARPFAVRLSFTCGLQAGQHQSLPETLIHNLIQQKALLVCLDFASGQAVFLDCAKELPNLMPVDKKVSLEIGTRFAPSFTYETWMHELQKWVKASTPEQSASKPVSPPRTIQKETPAEQDDKVQKAYQKAKSERESVPSPPHTQPADETSPSEDVSDDSTAGDSDAIAWENEHPELAGWV